MGWVNNKTPYIPVWRVVVADWEISSDLHRADDVWNIESSKQGPGVQRKPSMRRNNCQQVWKF